MQSNMQNLSLGISTPNIVRNPSPRDRQQFHHSDVHYVNQMSSSPMECKQNYSAVDFFPENIKRNSYDFDQSLIYSNSFYSQNPSSMYNFRKDTRFVRNPSHQYDDSYQRYSSSSSRASSATMNWLLDNYETADGVSLPRCTLYSHYKAYCNEMHHPPMNQASFGKLIRSVFPNLKTRRLGTRGNSKYHYYGIKIKMDSKLNRMIKDEFPPPRKPQTFKILTQPDHKNSFSKQVILYGKTDSYFSSENLIIPRKMSRVSLEIPPFRKIDINKITTKISNLPEIVNIFQEMYWKHCNEIKEGLIQFNFKLVPLIWTDFWGNFVKKKNSFERFLELFNSDEIIDFVFNSDCIFYQYLVSLLIPDVLQETSTSQTQNIRTFAKSLESQLNSALAYDEYNQKFVSLKIDAVAGFAQTLRRHTKLQHLANATRGILDDQSQLKVMCSDISKVDLGEIQDQMMWISNCKSDFMQKIQDDFISGLSQYTKIDQWTTWLEEIVNIVLAPYTTSKEFQNAAQQLLLKWSMYMSMVIRDLTLRSCLTFGSFHLIRLFFDDYMQYLVENKVAEFQKTTVVGLIAENRQTNLKKENGGDKSQENKKISIITNSIVRIS